MRERWKLQSTNLTLSYDLFIPKSIGVFLRSWAIQSEISALHVKRNSSHRVEAIKSLKSKFDLDLWRFEPQINRGSPRVMVNTCVKYHHSLPHGNGVIVRKRLKYKKSLIHHFKSDLTYNMDHMLILGTEPSLFEVQIWRNPRLKSKFDLELWPFDPEINRGPPWVMVNTCVKYHYCMWKVKGVIVRKLTFSTYGQTDNHGETSISHNFIDGWYNYLPL